MSIISIEGMEFFAYHGCFKEEQIIGTRFLVDIHLETDTSQAEHSDDLKQTVNYQSVYLMTKEEMAIKSKLLEHVGRRILSRIFNDFAAVEQVSLKISKMHPPVGGKVGSVSISFTETRDQNRLKRYSP
jgi:dihydroneopterin aldolase